MKFSRLTLRGFKSFADQTDLLLEPGLSGVVGPNGCGKSNLVEALRWVMGESSYKAMRAAGMDEVIFSGSANRPGRNSAEVTLVLDNSDRTAPAVLNSADVLEVTRHIERDDGSIYRVNGREVRARDVQLLFADASTGAHSPALVRQGQIGELIAAKPVQRRALLEEAAGISGLHSRRHDAELRLQAAEQNLDRVADIVAQLEAQLEQLRRQARLAMRYRSLSGEIRKTEATLFHVRWVHARVAEKETEADRGKLVIRLAEAQHAELEAQKALYVASEALQPLRNREAAAGAALQRLKLSAEKLADEARRAEHRRQELGERLAQVTGDEKRETLALAESEQAMRSQADELARLELEAAGDQYALDLAREAAAEAQTLVTAADVEARAAVDAAARVSARKAQARQNAEAARQQIARCNQQLADIARQSEAAARELTSDIRLSAPRAALATAQGAALDAEADVTAADTTARQSEQAVEAAQSSVQALESALGRLDAEAQTLRRFVDRGTDSQWPAVVDTLTVVAGYETALGAALGDDLEASVDSSAPVHWSPMQAHKPSAGLPDGVMALSEVVTGSDLVRRRLEQIGVVDAVDGPRLAGLLEVGQRLVSRDGDLWRWDGLVAASDAQTAAAERRAQRNRLADLECELAIAREDLHAKRHHATALADSLTRARGAEREARENWRLAQRQIATAQAEVDKAQRTLSELSTRQGALDEAKLRLGASLADARAALVGSEAALVEAGDEQAVGAVAADRERVLANRREQVEQTRFKLAGFETAARMRSSRLAQIAAGSSGWQRRRDGAAAQVATLRSRQSELVGQLNALAASPDAFEEQRAVLADDIATASAALQEASDRLVEAVTGHRLADTAQRGAAEGLSRVREQLVRSEERLNGLLATRHQIERQIVETLGIPASHTAQAAGIRPEAELPAEAPTELRVERLKTERGRLGGVNLTAESESEVVRQRLETLTADRDDLIGAIAKLRGGIQSLNREGRVRLAEAFETVNGYFRELFTSLFGGGTAELQFVNSDDPLEAGLEIMARPPGKKPTTMTLLSGGEQALTAMSLIFAVFLTNPAPICVLDEVDAPLDDANVERFCTLLDAMCGRTETRFLVITHNPITMSRMHRLFGVTMAERGVSQLVSVDLKGAEAVVAAVPRPDAVLA